MLRLTRTTVEALSPYVNPRDLRAMFVVTQAPFRWWPGLFGMAATTFWRFVWFKAGAFDESTPRGLALIAHESFHIGQAREMTWPLFAVRYAIGQFRCRFRHNQHPLEIPAIQLQQRVRAELEAKAR
jgi:hypothetical protein